MTHLSDEQFELLLDAKGCQDESCRLHAQDCPCCRDHLRQLQATRQCLCAAAMSLRPRGDLESVVRARLSQASAPGAMTIGGAHRWLRARIVPWVAAAAAVLLIVIPAAVYFSGPSAAHADQQQLAAIHQHNMSDGHGFYEQDDPVKLAAYFRQRLGFTPKMPRVGAGLAMRGCCVAKFRGDVVGSYVVNTPSGAVSIIVISQPPQSLKNVQSFARGGQTYWSSHFASNNMVMSRLDKYTYCAVGAVGHDRLTELLSQLVK